MVHMSQEQYEKLQQQRGDAPEQKTMDMAKGLWQRFGQAVAIDPGQPSGLAWTDGDRIVTETSDFWTLLDSLTKPTGILETIPKDDVAVLLEAPYLSRPGMRADDSKIAYNSGGVAREAELIEERLTEEGYHVEEIDPAGYGHKWDSQYAHGILGDWTGPDNEDTRDALRLLVFYNFV